MSHATVAVLLKENEIPYLHTVIDEKMKPFCEEGQWFRKGSKWDWFEIGGRWENFFDPGYSKPVSKWLEQKEPRIPFAILEGEDWFEKGQLGWFGSVIEEKSDWPEQAKKILEKHKDKIAVIVDYHV